MNNKFLGRNPLGEKNINKFQESSRLYHSQSNEMVSRIPIFVNLGKIPNLNITIKESFTLSYQSTEKGSPPAQTLFLLDVFFGLQSGQNIYPPGTSPNIPADGKAGKSSTQNIPAG